MSDKASEQAFSEFIKSYEIISSVIYTKIPKFLCNKCLSRSHVGTGK